jgi:hypothetical protein
VGLEGEPIPVEINSRKTATLNSLVPGKAPMSYTVERNVSVDLQVLPPIASDPDEAINGPKGGIRLVGGGQLRVSEKDSGYDKHFDFALCAQPGERVVIAKGSSDFGDTGAEFEVSVTVTLEKGKVRRPARLLRPGAPGLGPDGSSYRGGGYGSSYGNAYGGSVGPAPSPPPAGQPGVSRSW